MSITINLHHGRTKIVRNRVGGDGPHYASQERRGDKVYSRQLVDRMLDRLGGEGPHPESQERRSDNALRRRTLVRLRDHEARQELKECIHQREVEGTPYGQTHPHDLDLPDLPLVRQRLEHGDVHNGLTTVLYGVYGVAQWGSDRIEMPLENRTRSRRRRQPKTLTILVGKNGFISAACCG